ncbi:hypothetical protein BAnh1_11210 [Bartonella australis AUST/NH1]|uniref:Uncharacterized protein n=1 Tax=Bartonella australis (strain Aust/NH1) TaxID=1094489 RepID=M1N553_BARAA|nr:hypothetical protein [Bartonella australis]AGF74989.1 hypothetical protein BAnh1_11210 [Bartonella australis AUST/NH1]
MNSKYFLLYIFIFSLASTLPSFSYATTRTLAPVVFVLSATETDPHPSEKGDTFLPTVPNSADPKSSATPFFLTENVFYDSLATENWISFSSDIIGAVSGIIIKTALLYAFHQFYPLL